MRLALGIEYDGTLYHGWQSQPDRSSVQATLEQALSCVADQPIQVMCAGRTDARVHALEQVVHFDTTANRKPIAWVFGTNTELPSSIAVKWMREVSEDFHARYSAVQRHYEYIIDNSPTRSALWCQRMAWERRTLDAERMHLAAQHLLGEHDFSAFRASSCQAKTPVRHMTRVDVERHGHRIVVSLSANAFLHHMVRNIVGVLLHIGKGEAEPEWVNTLLDSRDRKQAANTAPACGLYLAKVDYPSTLLTRP
ncbi:MAG: tRNA pseudouridine synthase A [marine bacterium B5-7]|nr:MAG: tRNA pseudouridine synthase A [marine bacterium B5-7]